MTLGKGRQVVIMLDPTTLSAFEGLLRGVRPDSLFLFLIRSTDMHTDDLLPARQHSHRSRPRVVAHAIDLLINDDDLFSVARFINDGPQLMCFFY